MSGKQEKDENRKDWNSYSVRRDKGPRHMEDTTRESTRSVRDLPGIPERLQENEERLLALDSSTQDAWLHLTFQDLPGLQPQTDSSDKTLVPEQVVGNR